jgi:hypothetical protein
MTDPIKEFETFVSQQPHAGWHLIPHHIAMAVLAALKRPTRIEIRATIDGREIARKIVEGFPSRAQEDGVDIPDWARDGCPHCGIVGAHLASCEYEKLSAPPIAPSPLAAALAWADKLDPYLHPQEHTLAAAVRDLELARNELRELNIDYGNLLAAHNAIEEQRDALLAALAALKEEHAQTESYVRQLEAAIRTALENPAMMGSEDIDALAGALAAKEPTP